MQSCTINREAVTVLYGHLTIVDLSKESAKTLTGNVAATLAPARSHDSDGTRKHLHLSIHRGTSAGTRLRANGRSAFVAHQFRNNYLPLR